ncbi:MAG TPA: zf-HC2 domain-containing protein [Ktedonobacterales bacterium]
MSLSTSRHEWLRRVSDYHSGGASDAERAAVEAHLATCQECQEALAMYRRFYGLLRSPLRLGPPSVHFDEETIILSGTPYPPDDIRPPQRSRRSRMIATISAVVAAMLVVVGFLAVYATRSGLPAGTGTPTVSPTAISTVAATTTTEPTTTAQAGTFVCANPPGSNLAYAYVRGDHLPYIVTGCAAPRAIPAPTYSVPLAWSPTNRYLAVQTNASDGTYPVVIYDPASGQTHATRFVAGYPSDANYGQVIRYFLGWKDDNTFIGALQPVVSNNPNGPLGTSTIVTVDLASQAETPVGQVAWFTTYASTKIVAQHYLFYAGLKTMSEGQAYLHRLDLNTGTDTRLVPLGEYGSGPCQMTIFCNWTAPWDVSPDGTHVIYHNPAPTTFPSDTNLVQDTPLVYANIDGTNPSTPFGSRRAIGLSTPRFSPDGKYIIATGVSDNPTATGAQQSALAQVGGPVIIVDGVFDAWRGDSKAMVLIGGNPGNPFVYDLASHATTALEPGLFVYLWGN